MPKGVIQDYKVKTTLQEVSTGTGSTHSRGGLDGIKILDPQGGRWTRRRRRRPHGGRKKKTPQTG